MFDRHPTLHRYVTREFLKIFGLSLSSLILIYVVVLFFQKMVVLPEHHYGLLQSIHAVNP